MVEGLIVRVRSSSNPIDRKPFLFICHKLVVFLEAKIEDMSNEESGDSTTDFQIPWRSSLDVWEYARWTAQSLASIAADDASKGKSLIWSLKIVLN